MFYAYERLLHNKNILHVSQLKFELLGLKYDFFFFYHDEMPGFERGKL